MNSLAPKRIDYSEFVRIIQLQYHVPPIFRRTLSIKAIKRSLYCLTNFHHGIAIDVAEKLSNTDVSNPRIWPISSPILQPRSSNSRLTNKMSRKHETIHLTTPFSCLAQTNYLTTPVEASAFECLIAPILIVAHGKQGSAPIKTKTKSDFSRDSLVITFHSLIFLKNDASDGETAIKTPSALSKQFF